MLSARKTVLLGTVMFFVILFSEIIRSSILNSIQICIQMLIPALLPSFILCGMILDCGIDLIIPPKWAAFLIGLICGYPLGCSTVCRLYSQKKLTKAQAEQLLLCTTNASPAFVVIVIGSTILESKQLGYILLGVQTIIALLFFLCIPKSNFIQPSHAQSTSLGISLIDNIKKSAEQLCFVCTCTIVFGIIFDLLSQNIILHSKFLKIIFASTELTHGLTLYGENELYSVAAILGFSGIAVLSQCAYFVQKTDLKFRYVLIGKVLCGILLPCFTYLIIPYNPRKLWVLGIIILTNVFTMCIIRHKGCEKKHDIFKRNRKMLRLLRKGNKNCNERTGALSA
ncbi:MAG: hypothetical protein IJN42_03280 [Clostridia bacterium]|nr:hypothetical protein [Clostridia bacterium]